MKKQTLIIISLFLFGNCIGQVLKEQNLPDKDNIVVSWGTAINDPKQDTIKVIMQISDTSHGNYTALTSRVWWIKGYEVYDIEYGQVPCANPNLLMICYGYYRSKFIGYLDENKKTLSKSIIVWMSKEIKN